MIVPITVIFKTDSYLDASDVVIFQTNDNVKIEGKIYSYRNAPNLRIFIHNHSKDILCQKINLETDYDMQRAIALNNTIDCGFCFIGNSIKLQLNLINEGGKGEFFIMTEEEWYRKNVTVSYKNNCLSITLIKRNKF